MVKLPLNVKWLALTSPLAFSFNLLGGRAGRPSAQTPPSPLPTDSRFDQPFQPGFQQGPGPHPLFQTHPGGRRASQPSVCARLFVMCVQSVHGQRE
ncbi:hypothetical protein B0H67DRAFT_573604 [Lasiosphaeris hirsuta]|uniref:Secreted protein n=1 Tax=Lasiosphaeris hirsuta TaxID=260670 RepID=A0AA40API0_9PEZI|nr:hypothetical protein B0H67DRAFT_573604 [Lasiosphaeris hirsuta]